MTSRKYGFLRRRRAYGAHGRAYSRRWLRRWRWCVVALGTACAVGVLPSAIPPHAPDPGPEPLSVAARDDAGREPSRGATRERLVEERATVTVPPPSSSDAPRVEPDDTPLDEADGADSAGVEGDPAPDAPEPTPPAP